MKPIVKPLAAAVIASLLSASAAAEKVTVNPIPQQVTWGTNIVAIPDAVKIIGAADADKDAVAALNRVVASNGKMKLTIGERGDKAVKSVASKIPSQAEGYYLSVTPKEIIIAGNDNKGTFYGVQTLLQLIAGSNGELTEVEITDWPGSYNRGVVEGFYGNPWTHANRLHQFDFYGANKLDTYIYGPKDDPYHHSSWREPYPADKAAELKELAEAAARNKVWFVWAMHPGNSIESKQDRNDAINKLQLMYDMGFRSFAIFFDDISNYDPAIQADYLNYLTDNFVKKHPDVTPLIMCPSEYNKGWVGRDGKGDYLVKLGAMTYPEIRMMWTGNSVVDMIDVADVEWVEPYLQRKPFIWLNWPVNDFCVDHLLMGPFWGNEKETPAMCSGFVLNPMEYAEASLVSIYSGADFLWNPEAYDSQESWERAVKTLAPGHEDAFRTFCIYNVDLGQNGHRLRRTEETPELKALIEKYSASLSAGAAPEAEAAFRSEFARAEAAADELLTIADTDPLMSEIRPWIEVMKLLAQRGDKTMDMHSALVAGDSVGFINSYLAYADLTDRAAHTESRNFEGSITTANPVVGFLYAEPFISGHVGQMITDYRANHSYKTDLLPNPVIENGKYQIVDIDGRILGNPNAGSPVWQTEEDVVNPERQLWRISLNPEAARYQITNVKDHRYINEFAAFTADEAAKPFDPEWHTFIIERNPDGSDTYSIRNGGLDGLFYWLSDGDIIKPRRLPKGTNPYIFRFISK